MKRFKDYHLTEDEWKEVFSFPKKFTKGDLVEAGKGCGFVEIVWEVVAISPCKKGDDIVYQLKNLVDGRLEWFSSTFIQPFGTFVDTELFTKGVR
jgi:predicted metal-binding transcription factor (methanogenesis marker protein 9)